MVINIKKGEYFVPFFSLKDREKKNLLNSPPKRTPYKAKTSFWQNDLKMFYSLEASKTPTNMNTFILPELKNSRHTVG